MTETVAIVAPDMRGGGSVGAVAWRHALALSRTYRIHVITRAAPAEQDHDVNVIPVQPRRFDWLRRFCHVPNELAFVWAARNALKELCNAGRIDVVWCHSHATTALVAAPLKKDFGFRVVMTTHGDIFDRPPGAYSRELTWFYKQVTPRAYRRADFVQALSPYMAEWAVRGGARRERVRVIPNGVDPEEIGAGTLARRPESSFMPGAALRLLYVGSLWNLKGVDVLLRAAAELRAQGDSTPRDVRVTLIGDGPLRPELERLAAALGLAGQAQFLGNVPRLELARHYRQADILCVPSISEALSIVTLEGMLCGLPVAGSNTGGIPFLVDHGVNGYLASPGDAAGLAAAIRAAASSRAHLAELGRQGLQKAAGHFGWPQIAEQLGALARDAVTRGHEQAEAR